MRRAGQSGTDTNGALDLVRSAFSEGLLEVEVEVEAGADGKDDRDGVFESGFRCANLVNHVDIFPTIVDACDLARETRSINGTSLLKNLSTQPSEKPVYIELAGDFIEKRKWIKDFLGDFILSYTGGKASFYFYLTLKHIKTTKTSFFFRYLTRKAR